MLYWKSWMKRMKRKMKRKKRRFKGRWIQTPQGWHWVSGKVEMPEMPQKMPETAEATKETPEMPQKALEAAETVKEMPETPEKTFNGSGFRQRVEKFYSDWPWGVWGV